MIGAAMARHSSSEDLSATMPSKRLDDEEGEALAGGSCNKKSTGSGSGAIDDDDDDDDGDSGGVGSIGGDFRVIRLDSADSVDSTDSSLRQRQRSRSGSGGRARRRRTSSGASRASRPGAKSTLGGGGFLLVIFIGLIYAIVNAGIQLSSGGGGGEGAEAATEMLNTTNASAFNCSS